MSCYSDAKSNGYIHVVVYVRLEVVRMNEGERVQVLLQIAEALGMDYRALLAALDDWEEDEWED